MEPDLLHLAALLEQARLAVVVEGSHFDDRRRKANRVLGRTTDPAAVAELRCALRLVSGAERVDWMTPGGPTIALYGADRQYLAAITIVGPNRVRSHPLLQGDALLADPERMLTWISSIGIALRD